MLVYVETNFVLELALQQEQVAQAEALLALNRARQLTLVLPSFSLAEAYAQINRRTADRTTLFGSVQKQTRELSRSMPHQAFSRDLSSLANNLKSVNESQVTGLGDVITTLLEEAVMLEMTVATHLAARELVSRAVLEPQDANVYSIIIENLSRQPREVPKLFVSRDEDFRTPTIMKELNGYNCEYLHSFVAGHARVLAHLRRDDAGGPGK